MSDERLTLTAIPAETLETLLSRASGRRIAPGAIQDDIQKGAPQNADGTLNLIHYIAWLIKDRTHGSEEEFEAAQNIGTGAAGQLDSFGGSH